MNEAEKLDKLYDIGTDEGQLFIDFMNSFIYGVISGTGERLGKPLSPDERDTFLEGFWTAIYDGVPHDL